MRFGGDGPYRKYEGENRDGRGCASSRPEHAQSRLRSLYKVVTFIRFTLALCSSGSCYYRIEDALVVVSARVYTILALPPLDTARDGGTGRQRRTAAETCTLWPLIAASSTISSVRWSPRASRFARTQNFAESSRIGFN